MGQLYTNYRVWAIPRALPKRRRIGRCVLKLPTMVGRRRLKQIVMGFTDLRREGDRRKRLSSQRRTLKLDSPYGEN